MRRTCITLDLPPDRILSNCRIALQQLLVYGAHSVDGIGNRLATVGPAVAGRIDS